MKLLWITNIILPDACAALGMQTPVVGGWMQASAKALKSQPNVQLAVATVYSGTELKTVVCDSVTYYLLPSSVPTGVKYNKSLEPLWQKVKAAFKPDVVHIHGTEYTHGLAYIRACGAENVVVSIQGLVSVIHRYYMAGLSFGDIFRNITFRDLVRMNTIWQQKAQFYRRGLVEKEYIQSVKHVIGRTSWDKAHVLAINPQVNYHFCNETLRDEFYKHRWSYETCEKQTIFLSQASYPIKGLHQVLKALPLILRHYPNTKIYIAGDNLTNRSTLMARLKRTGYAKYITQLIDKLQIADHINFTGNLNEQEICQQYLKANVFVCPSSIENSPNSLGEAQLLGVPCIASYVGGVPDMIPNEHCGYMYRFEEVEMLAAKICEVFGDACSSSADDVAPIEAAKRHNKQLNLDALLPIYTAIVK
ncbi:MAG: glycosyltransferase family 4 protein [Alistipes sp.]